ncbi:MAG TPA: ChaN family lipoprotein, partial [Flavobacteriales bacterium]|nr:ChaN family lipoprotein [Flavobacteriales bacterium]
MRNPIILALLITLQAITASAQVRPAYMLFNSKGKKLAHTDLLRTARSGDIILFGEEHDNPIAHWLQLLVAQDLVAQGPL